jgi:hypothetical protein
VTFRNLSATGEADRVTEGVDKGEVVASGRSGFIAVVQVGAKPINQRRSIPELNRFKPVKPVDRLKQVDVPSQEMQNLEKLSFNSNDILRLSVSGILSSLA